MRSPDRAQRSKGGDAARGGLRRRGDPGDRSGPRVNRTKANPLEVQVLADVALPMVHDRLVAWDSLAPTCCSGCFWPVWRWIVRRCCNPSSSMFPSVEQAKKSSSVGIWGTFPIDNPYREMSLKSARYRRGVVVGRGSGSGGPVERRGSPVSARLIAWASGRLDSRSENTAVCREFLERVPFMEAKSCHFQQALLRFVVTAEMTCRLNDLAEKGERTAIVAPSVVPASTSEQ